MARTRVALLLAVGVAAVGLLAGSAFSQQGGGRGRWDPAQMQERMMQALKTNLHASDEEWKDVGPLVEKVLTLTSEVGGGLNRGELLGFGRGTGAPARGPDEEPSALEQAAEALGGAVADETSTAEDIEKCIAAYREARAAAREELAAARAELKEAVTPRQEGRLIILGLLE